MSELHCTDEPVVSSLANDPDLADLTVLYAQEMPERIEEMQRLFSAGDWPGLAARAHQLKGAAGSHGFHQLTAPAAAVECRAREERSHTEIEAALKILLDYCRRVR